MTEKRTAAASTTNSNEERLARIRAALTVINNPDASAEDSSWVYAVEDLATQVGALDESLSLGGALPSYWNGATI